MKASEPTIFGFPLVCAIILQASPALGRAQIPETDNIAPGPTLEAQCPGVIGDHAIFQQGVPIPIWGTSLPGAKVAVRFDRQRKTTVAVRYAYTNRPLDPYLYNKDGLPASPFSTAGDPDNGATN